MDIRRTHRASLNSLLCEELKPRHLLTSLIPTSSIVASVRDLGAITGGEAAAGVAAVADLATNQAVSFRFHLDVGGHYLLLVRHTGEGLSLLAYTPSGTAALRVGDAGPFHVIPLDLDAADDTVTASASDAGAVGVDWELLLDNGVGLAGLSRPIGSNLVALQPTASPAGANDPFSATSGPNHVASLVGLVPSSHGQLEPNQGVGSALGGNSIGRRDNDGLPTTDRVGAMVRVPGQAAGLIKKISAVGYQTQADVLAAALKELTRGEPTAGFGGDRLAGRPGTTIDVKTIGTPELTNVGDVTLVRPPELAPALDQTAGEPMRDGSGLTVGRVGSGAVLGAAALSVMIRRKNQNGGTGIHPRSGTYTPRSLLRSLLGHVD